MMFFDSVSNSSLTSVCNTSIKKFAVITTHIERTRLLPSCNMVVARLYFEVVTRLSQACCDKVVKTMELKLFQPCSMSAGCDYLVNGCAITILYKVVTTLYACDQVATTLCVHCMH